MLKKFVRLVGGDPTKREIDNYIKRVDQINSLEKQFESLSLENLREKTTEFQNRYTEGESLDDLLPEAFAVVRETAKRTIGLRHYDVQLIGGMVLHEGKIAEMRTGEGKTLVATLPLYLNALARKGTHLITVNDYLARRDARWMAPIYHALGLEVGVLQMAARTENGKKAFLVDLERSSPHEDQHQLSMVNRAEAYLADITYGTNSEFGFDYLRDNMTMRISDRVQRTNSPHTFAIIDEVDNILIDEARTPLIISGPAQDEGEWYVNMAQVVKGLKSEDVEVSEKDRTVSLTETGERHVEEILGTPLRDPDRPEDVTPEQARQLGYLEQALRAQYLYRRNKEYLVQAGKVVIVDEFTGRLMPGRRWSDGLHQAVEAKEGVKVEPESVTYATVTIQNYFRMYKKLAGMTGTALTEAEEFDKIYKLAVLPIPTNLEYHASRTDSELIEVEKTDEQGYKVNFYARRDDPLKNPVYWRRKDYPDIIFRTEEIKIRKIVEEILKLHAIGRPVLVGTTSVEMSDHISNRLRAEMLRRLVQVILIRHTWLESNNREEDGRQIQELQPLNQPLEKLDVTDLRKMARDINLPFNPEETDNLERLERIFQLPGNQRARLLALLQAGIPHQVLNARKHTEESLIIAKAGAFGAVTIATNMAGRGVDIKLGGELDEELNASINRLLERTGFEDAYDMNLAQRYRALQSLDSEAIGIYETQVQEFKTHFEDMHRVHELGGLHVIGSERHEARRIDNQLRGRSARQGDPGSTRFYLSMEDELMRRFGGAQADNLMQRLKIDDALPMEIGLVGRIVEQSQTRVEGYNFDVRKHLLEYDDVLNSQRTQIYTQRDKIFSKQDISSDIDALLVTEVNRRVPIALEDSGGPWKLLSWLEQIQPSIQRNGTVFPSYTLRLIIEDLFSDQNTIPAETAQDSLITFVREAMIAERDHVLQTIQEFLDQLEAKFKEQNRDSQETLDLFLEGLSNEEPPANRRPTELANDLVNTLRLPIRLTNDQLQLIRENPRKASKELKPAIENAILTLAAYRAKGAVDRRVEEPFRAETQDMTLRDWSSFTDSVLDHIHEDYERRLDRYLGEGMSAGQIRQDIEATCHNSTGEVTRKEILRLLIQIPYGTRNYFDKKTHRKMSVKINRLNYVFHAAQYLEKQLPEKITRSVLEHLQNAYTALQQIWGEAETQRLSAIPLQNLGTVLVENIQTTLGDTRYQEIASLAVQDIPEEIKAPIMSELGRRALTEINRQLLLRVISELWVDYLTQMESLRISIGLEAYAQRDPLVQYKSKASELFTNLLSNTRSGVIARMFTYLPSGQPALQSSPVKKAVPVQPVLKTAAQSQSFDPRRQASSAIAELDERGTEPDGEEPEDDELVQEDAGTARISQSPSDSRKKRRRRR